MKGLDTPILLGILDGNPVTRKVLRSLAGEEIATTELNMVELTAIAAEGGIRRGKDRLQVLEKLRRRITVLPIDHRTSDLLAHRDLDLRSAADINLAAILATFESAGCAEVLTDARSVPARNSWKVQLTRIAIK